MAQSLKWWYEYHREDYSNVRDRLTYVRNVMLEGRVDAAERLLRLSCVNAVFSIQTQRDSHERAFTAYAAGGVSLERASGMTVYGNRKSDWLHESLGTFDFGECVTLLREGGPQEALDYLVTNFKGLSWVKAGFALSMVGIWELACPDTRCRQFLDIDERIRTLDDYMDACQQIDDSLDVSDLPHGKSTAQSSATADDEQDIPLFIKQWAIYDYQAEEHARHMPFYVEALPHL